MTAAPIRARCRAGVVLALLLLSSASLLSAADICVSIDESRDTFAPGERSAALLLIARQFELEGEQVVQGPCEHAYVLTHVQLGRSISITLTGPAGRRDATAVGLEDVAAVYSQMVRSLVRGVPMSATGVVDRGNVATAQAREQKRVRADSLLYFRLGYTGTFGAQTMGAPSLGLFGYRRELDSFGVDVSIMNVSHSGQTSSSYYYYYTGAQENGVNTGTWLRLLFLRFTSPRSDRSPYFGGGLSWTTVDMNAGRSYWKGNGLQAEATAGYEFGRASTIRAFFQADVGLPGYQLRGEKYTFSGSQPYYGAPVSIQTSKRYAPSLTLSLGIGWQRGGK